MFQKIINTKDDISPFVIRVTLGIVMFAHGSQKMLGWFSDHGATWTVEMWQKWWGFPPAITWAVIFGEFFGPIFMVFGFCTRIMACITTAIMIGAMYFVTFKWGFYMNWYTESTRGEGYEYHILVLGICLALFIKGSGKYSIDRALMKRNKSKYKISN